METESIFFTADTHFYHENIIKYCNRQFDSLDDMNGELIKRWNRKIGRNETVYIIGDFMLPWMFKSEEKAFYRLVWLCGTLNGRKVLILGNHDYYKPREYLEAGIESVHTSLELNLDGLGRTVLVHDPCVATCELFKATWLVGHVHTVFKYIPERRVFNVGVDQHDYAPVSLPDIVAEIGKRGDKSMEQAQI